MENKEIFELLKRHVKYKPTTAYLQKEIEDEMLRLAEELNLNKETIRAAFVSQFRFIHNVIKNCVRCSKDENFDLNNYKSIRLPFLGRFEPKKSFIKKNTNG